MSTASKSNRTTPDRHPCEGHLRSGSPWSRHVYTCDKTAKIEREGKWYCGMHDPVRVAAKRLEREAKYDREAAERVRKWRIEQAAPVMLDALKFIATNSGDPVIENVARAAIAKAEGR